MRAMSETTLLLQWPVTTRHSDTIRGTREGKEVVNVYWKGWAGGGSGRGNRYRGWAKIGAGREFGAIRAA